MVQQENNEQVGCKGSWQNIFRIFFFLMQMFKRNTKVPTETNDVNFS